MGLRIIGIRKPRSRIQKYQRISSFLKQVGVYIITTSFINNLGIPNKVDRYVTHNLAI